MWTCARSGTTPCAGGRLREGIQTEVGWVDEVDLRVYLFARKQFLYWALGLD